MSRTPGRALLAVPLTSHSPSLVEQAEHAASQGADVLELRLDHLDPDQVAAALPDFPDLPLILTVRESSEGGAWQGAVADKLALLDRFLGSGAWVDLELALFEREADVRQWCYALQNRSEPGPALIISWHDFSPPDDTRPDRDDQVRRQLAAVGARMAETPADVEKLVCTATDMLEVLAVLDTASSERARIVLAMGSEGLPSRVLSGTRGGMLTFATAGGAESAPGQPSLATLRGLYRYDELDGQTPVLGVLGWPVTHSLSPLIHNLAMAEDGRAGVYLPFAVSPQGDALDRVLRRMLRDRSLPVHGCSVTLPHKETVLAWLRANGQEISPGADACGAVNTLVRTAHGWRGENSDVIGVRAALEEVGWEPDGPVTVLGAGGVARAALAALGAAAAEATVYNRTLPRAEQLAADFECSVGLWDQRHEAAGSLLINATSIGMAPAVEALPLEADFVGRHSTVFDTIYTPAATQLLRVAAECGCRCASGLTMFVAQAEQQYRWWFGQDPPRGSYRRTLLDSLSQTG